MFIESARSYELNRLFEVFGQDFITDFTDIQEEEVPAPMQDLLSPNHHMTHAIEKHFNTPTTLQVWGVFNTGSHYARKITLSVEDRVVQYAFIIVDLQQLGANAATDVLEGVIPMGRILAKHKINTQVSVKNLLHIENSAHIGQHLPLPAYGRVASIMCNDKPAIQVMEVLNTNAFNTDIKKSVICK